MRGSTVGSTRRSRPKKLWKDRKKLDMRPMAVTKEMLKVRTNEESLLVRPTTTLGIKPWYSVRKHNAYSIFSLRLPCWQLKNKYPVSLQHNFAVS